MGGLVGGLRCDRLPADWAALWPGIACASSTSRAAPSSPAAAGNGFRWVPGCCWGGHLDSAVDSWCSLRWGPDSPWLSSRRIVGVAKMFRHHSEVPHPQGVLNSPLESGTDIVWRPQVRAVSCVCRYLVRESPCLFAEATIRLYDKWNEICVVGRCTLTLSLSLFLLYLSLSCLSRVSLSLCLSLSHIYTRAHMHIHWPSVFCLSPCPRLSSLSMFILSISEVCFCLCLISHPLSVISHLSSVISSHLSSLTCSLIVHVSSFTSHLACLLVLISHVTSQSLISNLSEMKHHLSHLMFHISDLISQLSAVSSPLSSIVSHLSILSPILSIPDLNSHLQLYVSSVVFHLISHVSSLISIPHLPSHLSSVICHLSSLISHLSSMSHVYLSLCLMLYSPTADRGCVLHRLRSGIVKYEYISVDHASSDCGDAPAHGQSLRQLHLHTRTDTKYTKHGKNHNLDMRRRW